MDPNIINTVHPLYAAQLLHWHKWRLTYCSGEPFVHRFLQQFSKREAHEDYRLRRNITYCPAFAKAAVNKFKNSIFQRINDVVRAGGPKSYQDATLGKDGGVDRAGSTMNAFIGTKILPELLPMSKVGVFIDMPPLFGETIADKADNTPYLYAYNIEQIRSWTVDPRQPDRYLALLLRDNTYFLDDKTGLTNRLVTQFRHLWIGDDNKVHAQYYSSAGAPNNDEVILNISEIPFVCFEISESLLADAADYQIALLNLESSDLMYALRSNFPFYTEQYDSRSESPYLKKPGDNVEVVSQQRTREGNVTSSEKTQEINIGPAAGRRYPVGAERPAFINPSSEPLQISMAKAEQIKKDIDCLVTNAVENLQSTTGQSVGNENPLETGLAYIGLELERAERRIAYIWSLYENSGKEVPTVSYPDNYNVKTEEDRRLEALHYEELIPKIPSKRFQKEASKKVVALTLGNKISLDTIEEINKEIDSSVVIITDPDIIKTDLENGLVSVQLASTLRGYPAGQVEQAAKDHAERLARIAISQSQGIAAAGARGVSDMGADPQSATNEKVLSQKDKTYSDNAADKTRGAAQ